MNLKTYSLSMIVGFTLSTLAIVFGTLSLNFEDPSVPFELKSHTAAPVAAVTCQTR